MREQLRQIEGGRAEALLFRGAAVKGSGSREEAGGFGHPSLQLLWASLHCAVSLTEVLDAVGRLHAVRTHSKNSSR